MSKDLSADGSIPDQLSLAGWRVLKVSDPVEALAAAKSEDIGLAILHYPLDEAIDMDLPNVLRSIAPGHYVPVMIIACDAAEGKRCEFLDSGADDVASDATSTDEIVARARALLRVKRLHDELAGSRRALEQSVERERKLLAKLRRRNAHLRALCATDPLTHVQNIRSFGDILHHEFRMARRYEEALSLLMMDVDHFKLVNDMYGHPSGDYVLKELAAILKQTARQSDVVARTGGDEFGVILPKADHVQAAHLADRIRQEIGRHRFMIHGHDIYATVSVGLATFPDDTEIVDAEMLVFLGDQALLQAKEQGRDRVVAVHQFPEAVLARLRTQCRATRKTAPAARTDAAPR